APKVSLVTLIFAAQFLDFLWPALIYLGIEHVRIIPGITVMNPLDFYDYPYSHSLFMALIYSFCFGGIYFAVRRSVKEAWVLAVCVFSHWVLDLVTHRPDLPLAPGVNMVFGLGLWNNVSASVLVEVALYIVGVMLYLQATRAKKWTGTVSFWSLAMVLALGWVVNIFGPPLPDPKVLGAFGVVMSVITIFWAWWIESTRETLV
ncbi:MAG: hypothetical protein PHF95_06825, partial [bacterium]|nr:hypothetical protein [bacterium]